jgi:hypothetical protein
MSCIKAIHLAVVSALILPSLPLLFPVQALGAVRQDCQGRFIFYEGNDLTQAMLGDVSDCFATFHKLKELNLANVPNDEARSVQMLNVKAGTTLIVYDSPDCSTDDDWTEIYIKTDIQDRRSPSFEIPRYDDDEINVVWHEKNGLDGKVSCIQVKF